MDETDEYVYSPLDERRFEIVSAFKDKGIKLPQRATKSSAGYDIYSAETITIPSIWKAGGEIADLDKFDPRDSARLLFLSGLVKPTLVKTGIKVLMPRDNVLMLYNRSSNPVKRGLVLANGVGVIDSDYYDNKSNEGQIFGSFYNFGAQDYTIKKGDAIMQGIFNAYLVTENDKAIGDRTGGFGSTDDD